MQVEVLNCKCAPQKHPFGYLHCPEECPFRTEAAQAPSPWFLNRYGKTKVKDCDALLSIHDGYQTVCSFCGFCFKDDGIVFHDPEHKHSHFPNFNVDRTVKLEYTSSSTKQNPKGRLQFTNIIYGTCHKRLSLLGMSVKQ